MFNDCNICVVLLTYNRLDYAKRTLRSLFENAHGATLGLHIADDGSPEGYVDELVHEAREYIGDGLITLSCSGGRGYGANYNLAMQTVHGRASLILPLEDDWELRRSLDLGAIASGLNYFGCIRMGYIGYTDDIVCRFVRHNDMHWLELDPHSPEKHVFAGHPRLETVQWERRLGPWTEDLMPGETELDICSRREARMDVAWPISLIPLEDYAFVHIGTERSY